jgi:hypothetical protein
MKSPRTISLGRGHQMPIRPIDLQTLLMQMSQVGRDQAVEKDGPALQSAIQGAAAQKKEIETKEAVRRPEEPKDGAAAIKERPGRSSAQGGKGGHGGEEGVEDEGKPQEEVVRDPSLGNRVDLSG